MLSSELRQMLRKWRGLSAGADCAEHDPLPISPVQLLRADSPRRENQLPASHCLAHLPEPGRLRLLPWEAADKVLKLSRALRRRTDPTAEQELRLLEDIYRRLHIEPPGRIQLPHLLLVHLSGGIAKNQFFYVVRYVSSIEIWSMEYRNAALKRRPESFEDLP